jgi:phosphate transport system substrate-binding protein
MDRLTQEFITFVLSKEGQSVVVKDGYFPLPAKVVTDTLKLIK